MKELTLCFPRYSEELVLLGMKKKGLGKGLWNGFGGKVEEDETIVEATARELEEESGLFVYKSDLIKIADLTFRGDLSLHVSVFQTFHFTGEPQESDEMIPKWFTLDTIPLPRMCADDKYWLLPALTGGHPITGTFFFESEKMLSAVVSHYFVQGKSHDPEKEKEEANQEG